MAAKVLLTIVVILAIAPVSQAGARNGDRSPPFNCNLIPAVRT
jgi:hypothetical protein